MNVSAAIKSEFMSFQTRENSGVIGGVEKKVDHKGRGRDGGGRGSLSVCPSRPEAREKHAVQQTGSLHASTILFSGGYLAASSLQHVEEDGAFVWMLKIPNEVKIFYWLFTMDRLSTAEPLFRHSTTSTCQLCDGCI